MREEKAKKEEKEESEEKDILASLLSGERITEKEETKRGVFVIALPLPRDVRIIEVTVAKRLGGQPITSFTADTISLVRAYATLDIVIIESPKWWRELQSAEDCPDDTFIIDLYRRYLQFYQKIQRRIGRSRFGGNIEVGKARTKVKPVDNGAFSGLTDG
jgi:hypothetical protein